MRFLAQILRPSFIRELTAGARANESPPQQGRDGHSLVLGRRRDVGRRKRVPNNSASSGASARLLASFTIRLRSRRGTRRTGDGAAGRVREG
jgi:hypothetical protein